MSHHKKKPGPAPVPPGNLPQNGPVGATEASQQAETAAHRGAPFQDQDSKRRLGNYEGAGEHAFQQPGGKNDANH